MPKQFRQMWTSSPQIAIGAVLHTLQKPSCVSVGAAGTGRWAHPGVWRYGELAGMLWQRSVLPMCSSAIGERGLVLLPGDGVQLFTFGRAYRSRKSLSYKPFIEIISRTTAASPRTRASTPPGSSHHGEVATSTPLG